MKSLQPAKNSVSVIAKKIVLSFQDFEFNELSIKLTINLIADNQDDQHGLTVQHTPPVKAQTELERQINEVRVNGNYHYITIITK